MTGEIQGGWEFVWAAYGVSAAFLGLYTASIIIRYRNMKSRTMKREGLS
jgi:hypothetical protein